MREMALPHQEFQKGSALEKVADLLKRSGEWFDRLGKEVGKAVVVTAMVGGTGGALYEGFETLQHVSTAEYPSVAAVQIEHHTDSHEGHLGYMLGGLALAGAGLLDYTHRKSSSKSS